MKILFYDGWTKGIRCFKTIEKELKARQHETLLVHTGSYKEDVPKEEYIDGLLCRDISYYKTNLIYNVLKEEKPDVLFSLNTKYLWDRANVMACRKLGIKTVFFMHGETFVGDEIDAYIKNRRDGLLGYLKKLDKASTYLFKVVPNYLHAIYKYKASELVTFKKYQTIFSYLLNPDKGRLKPVNTEDLIHDLCLVYSKRYYNFYRDDLNYPEKAITIVGKPEYDTYFEALQNAVSTSDLSPKIQNQIKDYSGFVLYIENGFCEANFEGWTIDYRNYHLKTIADKLKENNKLLVIKTHPLTKTDTIELSDNMVIENENVLNLARLCDYSIVHASTLNDLPIMLKKPVVIPQWEASEKIAHFYSKYPQAVNFWKDAKTPIPIMLNKKAREEYITDNLVIYKNGNTAKNLIVNLIEETVEQT